MATIIETVEGSLFPYLQQLYGSDFDRLRIRNYGFQAPGLLDPTRSRNGYNLNGVMDNSEEDAPGLHISGVSPEKSTVLMGKIIPFSEPTPESYRQSFRLGHQIKRSIVDWAKCEAVGLTECPHVRFAITEDQDRNTASSVKSKWWVLRWQFDLVGHFDV